MPVVTADLVLFGPPGQGGFNGSALLGAQAAQKLGHTVHLHWVQGDAAARIAQLQAISEASQGLVVLHGGQGVAPLSAVAAHYPDQSFALTQGHVQARNVACYEVLQEHSAFLAGVLAAHLSQTGKVAHLSGDRVTPGLKGRAAFLHGYEAAGGQQFATVFTGHQHDAALTEQYADALFESGADVVFAMIDGGRPGLIRACERWNVRHIGNVLDWVQAQPDHFIASAVADSGKLVTQAIADFAAGTLPLGQIHAIGLEQPEWVRLTLADAIGADVRSALDAWRAKIVSGEVRVQTEWSGPEFEMR